MFGYVTADPTQLSPEEQARYSGCYCGLCRRLGKLCGQRTRLTLTYDITFLILVLNAVYGGQERETSRRCLPHPLKKHPGWYSEWTDYGAWMNVALGYYKCLDDWQDDHKLSARLAAAALHRPLRRAEQRYPRQCAVIRRELDTLSALEREGINDPDKAAASFGRLMAALFVQKEDEYARALGQLGYFLGEFIYLVDARLDLADDLKNEAYNPLTSLTNPDMEPVLTMLLSRAAEAAERLPLQTDAHLIYNILYAGVWLKYQSWKAKREDEHNV
ncbi:MAG: DUF5685 family protein [Oscillospiraceae bacterium]|nr:DUF5685 family protein [Oscillospiraceae bacterium]